MPDFDDLGCLVYDILVIPLFPGVEDLVSNGEGWYTVK